MIYEKCDGGGAFLYSQVIPMPAPYALAPTLAVIASGIIQHSAATNLAVSQSTHDLLNGKGGGALLRAVAALSRRVATENLDDEDGRIAA